MVDILVVIQSAGAIQEFIEEGGLYLFLKQIGSNELEAAEQVLGDIQYESSKRLAVTRALTHLESAHQHFYSIWKRNTDVFSLSQERDIQILDFWTCCLMAICHKYLKSNHTKIVKVLEFANNAYWGKVGLLKEAAQGLFFILDPRTWIKTATGGCKLPFPTTKEWQQFCEDLVGDPYIASSSS
jgi:hypothetical protein